MARVYGRPAHGQYPSHSPEEEIFSNFLATLTTVSPWKWQGEHLDWVHLEEAHTRGEPVADVAVVYSPSTRDGSRPAAAIHCAETFGWCQALGLSGVQFEPLPGLYATADQLRNYRALIMPYCMNMPSRLVDDIAAYVRRGGCIVFTGVAGRHDRLGLPLGNDALFRAMGIRGLTMIDPVAYNFRTELFEGGVDRTIQVPPGHLPGAAQSVSLSGACRFDAALDEDRLYCPYPSGRDAASTSASSRDRSSTSRVCTAAQHGATTCNPTWSR
jgi:hypothetical protein